MTPERIAQLRAEYNPETTYCNARPARAITEALDALVAERARAERAEADAARLRQTLNSFAKLTERVADDVHAYYAGEVLSPFIRTGGTILLVGVTVNGRRLQYSIRSLVKDAYPDMKADDQTQEAE